MTQVRVVQDGIEFTGTVESGDRVPDPVGGGLMERLVVARSDDGSKVYVYPEKAGVQVAELNAPPVAPGVPASPMPGLEHLAPGGFSPPSPSDPSVHVVGSGPPPSSAPSAAPSHTAPQVGTTIGGVPAAASLAPPFAGMPVAPAVAAASARPPRFMVQTAAKRKPTVYHTREDCSKVTADTKRKPVDDDDIAFFDLTACSSCQRRDAQISWAEAIEEAVRAIPGGTPPMVMAPVENITAAVVSALKANGFRVTPELVER